MPINRLVTEHAPYGYRLDGTPKGTGYFGRLKMTDGSGGWATELSLTDSSGLGKVAKARSELYPMLVPTLTSMEINYLLSGKEPTEAIIRKAREWRDQRVENGLSPFAQLNERYPLPSRFPQDFSQDFSTAELELFKPINQTAAGSPPLILWEETPLGRAIRAEHRREDAIDPLQDIDTYYRKLFFKDKNPDQLTANPQIEDMIHEDQSSRRYRRSLPVVFRGLTHNLANNIVTAAYVNYKGLQLLGTGFGMPLEKGIPPDIPQTAGALEQTVRELPGQIFGGISDWVHNIATQFDDAGDWVNEEMITAAENAGAPSVILESLQLNNRLRKWIIQEIAGADDPDVRGFPPAQTVPGNIARTLSTWLGSFAPVSKILKAIGVNKWFTAVGAGAVADNITFDPNGKRLADFWKELGLPENVLISWLAASGNEDDSEMEKRLKLTLEGVGLGVMFDIIWTALRATKSALNSTSSTNPAFFSVNGKEISWDNITLGNTIIDADPPLLPGPTSGGTPGLPGGTPGLPGGTNPRLLTGPPPYRDNDSDAHKRAFEALKALLGLPRGILSGPIGPRGIPPKLLHAPEGISPLLLPGPGSPVDLSGVHRNTISPNISPNSVIFNPPARPEELVYRDIDEEKLVREIEEEELEFKAVGLVHLHRNLISPKISEAYRTLNSIRPTHAEEGVSNLFPSYNVQRSRPTNTIYNSEWMNVQGWHRNQEDARWLPYVSITGDPYSGELRYTRALTHLAVGNNFSSSIGPLAYPVHIATSRSIAPWLPYVPQSGRPEDVFSIFDTNRSIVAAERAWDLAELTRILNSQLRILNPENLEPQQTKRYMVRVFRPPASKLHNTTAVPAPQSQESNDSIIERINQELHFPRDRAELTLEYTSTVKPEEFKELYNQLRKNNLVSDTANIGNTFFNFIVNPINGNYTTRKLLDSTGQPYGQFTSIAERAGAPASTTVKTYDMLQEDLKTLDNSIKILENFDYLKELVRDNLTEAATKRAFEALVESFRVGNAATPKTVRLYRAEENPDAPKQSIAAWITESDNYKNTLAATGRWFTDDRAEAQWYLDHEYPNGILTYIDVPADQVESFRVSNIAPKPGGKSTADSPRAFSSRTGKEFFVSPELAATRQRLPIEQAIAAEQNDPKMESILRYGEARKSQLALATFTHLSNHPSDASIPRDPTTRIGNLLDQDQVLTYVLGNPQTNIYQIPGIDFTSEHFAKDFTNYLAHTRTIDADNLSGLHSKYVAAAGKLYNLLTEKSATMKSGDLVSQAEIDFNIKLAYNTTSGVGSKRYVLEIQSDYLENIHKLIKILGYEGELSDFPRFLDSLRYIETTAHWKNQYNTQIQAQGLSELYYSLSHSLKMVYPAGTLQPFLMLKDNWWQFFVNAEIKKGIIDGVEFIHFPTPTTTAKLENFNQIVPRKISDNWPLEKIKSAVVDSIISDLIPDNLKFIIPFDQLKRILYDYAGLYQTAIPPASQLMKTLNLISDNWPLKDDLLTYQEDIGTYVKQNYGELKDKFWRERLTTWPETEIRSRPGEFFRHSKTDDMLNILRIPLFLARLKDVPDATVRRQILEEEIDNLVRWNSPSQSDIESFQHARLLVSKKRSKPLPGQLQRTRNPTKIRHNMNKFRDNLISQSEKVSSEMIAVFTQLDNPLSQEYTDIIKALSTKKISRTLNPRYQAVLQDYQKEHPGGLSYSRLYNRGEDIGTYVKQNYGAKLVVDDDNNSWWQIDLRNVKAQDNG